MAFAGPSPSVATPFGTLPALIAGATNGAAEAGLTGHSGPSRAKRDFELRRGASAHLAENKEVLVGGEALLARAAPAFEAYTSGDRSLDDDVPERGQRPRLDNVRALLEERVASMRRR